MAIQAVNVPGVGKRRKGRGPATKRQLRARQERARQAERAEIRRREDEE